MLFRSVVVQLSVTVQKVLQNNEVRERLSNIGADTVGGTPEQFSAFIANEYERWSRLIRERRIKSH